MPLDSNADKIAKAPDHSVLSSLNLNSVADTRGPKPAQIADDGVFNRNRGQGQVPQGGRAHPFLDTGVSKSPDGKLIVGQDPPSNRTPVQPFKEHAADQALKLKDLDDQQQAQVNAAARHKIVGNALALGFADNALYAKELVKNWDLIGIEGGLEGAAGQAGRVGLVGASAFAMGVVAQPILKRDLSVEKASIQPVHDAYRKEIFKLRNQAIDDLAKASPDPTRAVEAQLAKEKSQLLTDFLQEKGPSKLDALSQFNKDHPAAFSSSDKATMKALAEHESRLNALNGVLKADSDLSRFGRFYENGKAGLWKGVKFVAGSLALNYAFKEGFDLLPGEHHETDRIFTQSTQESWAQGLIGAAPIRNPVTKIAYGGAAWLAGREEKMTTAESIVSTGLVMGGTLVAAGLIKSLRSSVPKALLAEGAAFLVGRGVHLIPGVGSSIPELTDTSTDAWNAMKNDSLKRTGTSLTDAVDSFDLLGTKWRGVLGTYHRDVVINGVQNRGLAIVHGNIELNNYDNIITNSRTGMVLSESLGNTVLKAGLTGDTKRDLLETYHQQSSDEKTISDDTIIASNQGDLDLTSRAARSYMQALAFADVTMANMKAAQHQANGDASAKNITDADIKAVADEKAKIEKVMREKILRTTPGTQAHDIKDIVEGTDRLKVSFDYIHKFKLTDYAKDDQNGYSHMVDAIEDKAYAARDSWLPNQLTGPNAEISKQYVAKTFRDAAVLRLGFMNYSLTTQDGYSFAPRAQDLQAMKMYMEGSQIGNQLDGPHANRNVKSAVEAAYALDPNNPDMKAIVDEYNSIANRVIAFNQHYKDTHNGQDPYVNQNANPFGIQPPANAH